MVPPRTLESYAHIVRVYPARRLGYYQLRQFAPAHVQALLNDSLATAKSQRTGRYALAVLRRAPGQAVRCGRLPRSIALRVTPPTTAWHEQTALTLEQGRDLLAAARSQRPEALYRVALTLGLRLGEVLGLRVAQPVQRIWGQLVFGERRRGAVAARCYCRHRCTSRSPLTSSGSAPLKSERATRGRPRDWSSPRAWAPHWKTATSYDPSRRCSHGPDCRTFASTTCDIPARLCSLRRATMMRGNTGRQQAGQQFVNRRARYDPLMVARVARIFASGLGNSGVSRRGLEPLTR